MKNIKGLRVNFDSGEGEVKMPDEFNRQDVLWRADVLKDWLFELTNLYNGTVAEMQEENVARRVVIHPEPEKMQ